MTARFRAIDPNSLAKHFDAPASEARWHDVWQQSGVYHYDASRSRDETFVIDTPPPTVSGSLHVGHVFSYTQTDVIARYQRMLGKNIYYPIGWDDNGLPTERRVQTMFHVRCDPSVPYEEGLELEEASAKAKKKPARMLSRQNFIELCHQVTERDEVAFKELWSRVGLSVDWRQEYATMDDHCRKIAQLSFLDLFERGHVYTTYAPTMWDVDFCTAVAQAEVEDKLLPGAYHHIEFGVADEQRSFVIATTRPELLAACVGVTAHPDDERYKDLFGKQAVTPLFKASVPIFPSEVADPEKGTGILMVCTFGDQTDVDWWRAQGLETRVLIGQNGRLRDVTFGEAPFESRDPEMANRYYAEIAGKNVKQAQKRMVELLAEAEGSATGGGAPLVREPEAIEHTVKFYERGERPLELIPTRQWFCRLLDRKQELLAKGEEVQWHPPFMHARYRDWTENLALDWNVSRQRYFGVAIPVWYQLDEDGQRDYENPIVPNAASLPMDPMTDVPPGFEESQRGKPGGFEGEGDVFDTWFTSSMTPQVGSHWGLDPERHARLFPADFRPQSHEIIRTWAFYTIAKALLHEDSIPWKHVAISGWILDPDRKKMSKSKGNVVTPMSLLEKYSTDAVRYWASSARLGVDTAFDEGVFKIGKRLVTKLFNAGKFVLSQEAEVYPISEELDRAFVAKLADLVSRSTRSFEEWNYASALQEAESFFWSHFTDTYLELVKARARAEGAGVAAARGSAVASLRLGLDVLLRLLAPFLPYITEEVWSWCFAEEKGQPCIHTAPWPSDLDFEGIAAPSDPDSFEIAVACWGAINKAKSEASVSMGRETLRISIVASPKTGDKLAPVLRDVLAAARCQEYQVVARDGTPDGEFLIEDAVFAEKPEG
jgi:valyl-tRNA synthetase